MKIPIRKSKEMTEYSKLRRIFFADSKNAFCKAQLPGCTINATDVHHREGGSNRSSTYLDTTTWVPVCRACHNYIHDKLSKDDRTTLGL